MLQTYETENKNYWVQKNNRGIGSHSEGKS